MNSVVVSGIGFHGPFDGPEHTFTDLSQGKTSIQLCRPCTKEFHDLPPFPGALCKKADFTCYVEKNKRKLIKYMNRTTETAIIAAGQALQDAQLLHDKQRCQSMALFVTTGHMSFDLSSVLPAIEASKGEHDSLDLKEMGNKGLFMCHPLMPFKMLLNMPLGLISIIYGIGGTNFVLYPGPFQAAHCFEIAFRGIQQGRFERVLVGASSDELSFFQLCNLKRLGALAQSVEATQPFTEGHEGFAPTTGAAFVVLESQVAASNRGVKPLAKLMKIKKWKPLTGDFQSNISSFLEEFSILKNPIIVLSGTRNRKDDSAFAPAIHRLNHRNPAQITTFDGQVGIWGSASFPFATALTSLMISKGKILPWADPFSLKTPYEDLIVQSEISLKKGGISQKILVVGTDPERSLSAALLEPVGEIE